MDKQPAKQSVYSWLPAVARRSRRRGSRSSSSAASQPSLRRRVRDFFRLRRPANQPGQPQGLPPAPGPPPTAPLPPVPDHRPPQHRLALGFLLTLGERIRINRWIDEIESPENWQVFVVTLPQN